MTRYDKPVLLFFATILLATNGCGSKADRALKKEFEDTKKQVEHGQNALKSMRTARRGGRKTVQPKKRGAAKVSEKRKKELNEAGKRLVGTWEFTLVCDPERLRRQREFLYEKSKLTDRLGRGAKKFHPLNTDSKIGALTPAEKFMTQKVTVEFKADGTSDYNHPWKTYHMFKPKELKLFPGGNGLTPNQQWAYQQASLPYHRLNLVFGSPWEITDSDGDVLTIKFKYRNGEARLKFNGDDSFTLLSVKSPEEIGEKLLHKILYPYKPVEFKRTTKTKAPAAKGSP